MQKITRNHFDDAKLFITSDIERELELARAKSKKSKKHLKAAGLTHLGPPGRRQLARGARVALLHGVLRGA